MKKLSSREIRQKFKACLLTAAGMAIAVTTQAGTKEQARRLHERLAGVPPASPAMLSQVEAQIAAGRPKDAAMIIMNTESFYNVTLRNMFNAWSNVSDDSNVPLNDYTATAIGLIRDNEKFDQALYGDVIYTGPDNLNTVRDAVDPNIIVTQGITEAYSTGDNKHYIDLDTKLINPANPTDLTAANRTVKISLKTYLTKKVQSTLVGYTDTAGVLTTREGGFGYYTAGTNRRALRFTMKNFLCLDIDSLRDTAVPDFRVRRDVDRAPGGDSRTYKQTCVGCHAGMDGLAGAFARVNFSGNKVNFSTGVQNKYNQNSTIYPAGYVTTDNSWINLWATGQNSFVGWKGASSGMGIRSLGEMLSKTDAFSQCMVKRVFKRVCMRDAKDTENDTIIALANAFAQNGNYNMRDLFANVATLPQCMGD